MCLGPYSQQGLVEEIVRESLIPNSCVYEYKEAFPKVHLENYILSDLYAWDEALLECLLCHNATSAVTADQCWQEG